MNVLRFLLALLAAAGRLVLAHFCWSQGDYLKLNTMQEILLVGVDLAPCHSHVLLWDVLEGIFADVVRLKTISLRQDYL